MSKKEVAESRVNLSGRPNVRAVSCIGAWGGNGGGAGAPQNASSASTATDSPAVDGSGTSKRVVRPADHTMVAVFAGLIGGELVCISLSPKDEYDEDEEESKGKRRSKKKVTSSRVTEKRFGRGKRSSPPSSSRNTDSKCPWYFAASDISCSLSVVHQFKRADFRAANLDNTHDDPAMLNFVAPSRVSAGSGPNRPLSARMRPQSGRRRSLGVAMCVYLEVCVPIIPAANLFPLCTSTQRLKKTNTGPLATDHPMALLMDQTWMQNALRCLPFQADERH